MRILSDDVMWEALVSCDRTYDGMFFYAVKTTHIFCRPSCKSRPPLRENAMFFSQSSIAINAGFRPCKRCRPDLIEEPSDSSVIALVQALIEQRFASTLTLDSLADEVNLSKYHLHRLFKRVTGLTPQAYITHVRMQHASKLLRQTNVSITDIAHQSGYKSSAHFSENFHRFLGSTPTEYRKSAQSDTPSSV